MRVGINYDTGIYPGNRKSRPIFNREQVAFDLDVIARDLRCAAVRITGGDLERLVIASDHAAAAGIDVWLSPFPCESDANGMLALFAECAKAAEALRLRYRTKVGLILGCEVSVFGRGFLPGSDAYARMRQLSAPSPELFAEYPVTVARLNEFLAEAAGSARAEFGGPVTYASGPWEQIDWAPFDVIGVDAYRDRSNADTFEQQLDTYGSQGKPVVVTEFGCCTYRGAADRGAGGWMVLESDGDDRRLNDDYVRDEGEQVRYLRELVEIYRRHGIGTAFWFTFASWNRPHLPGVRRDLDIASFGVVKVVDDQASTPESCWRRKAVFAELASVAGESCAARRE